MRAVVSLSYHGCVYHRKNSRALEPSRLHHVHRTNDLELSYCHRRKITDTTTIARQLLVDSPFPSHEYRGTPASVLNNDLSPTRKLVTQHNSYLTAKEDELYPDWPMASVYQQQLGSSPVKTDWRCAIKARFVTSVSLYPRQDVYR